MQTSETRKEKMISVKLDDQIVASLDSIVDMFGTTRSSLVSKIIHESLPEKRGFEKKDILKTGVFLQWVLDKNRGRSKIFPRKKTCCFFFDAEDVKFLKAMSGVFYYTKSMLTANIITAVVSDLDTVCVDDMSLVELLNWIEGLKKFG